MSLLRAEVSQETPMVAGLPFGGSSPASPTAILGLRSAHWGMGIPCISASSNSRPHPKAGRGPVETQASTMASPAPPSNSGSHAGRKPTLGGDNGELLWASIQLKPVHPPCKE